MHLQFRHLPDDAYISFRYAMNFAGGAIAHETTVCHEHVDIGWKLSSSPEV